MRTARPDGLQAGTIDPLAQPAVARGDSDPPVTPKGREEVRRLLEAPGVFFDDHIFGLLGLARPHSGADTYQEPDRDLLEVIGKI